ncbi:unnamed protein product [Diamesa hyperborea]
MNHVDHYEYFLTYHQPQLVASGVPEIFWKSLCNKLTNQIFDAGNYFKLLLVEYEEDEEEGNPMWSVSNDKEDGIKADDPDAIFLIDHALTYKSSMLRTMLMDTPNLVKRLGMMFGFSARELSSDVALDKVLVDIWKYCNHYSINAQGASVEDSLPMWYVNDELGSAIQHNNDPSFRIVPFIHLPEQTTYSLLFPIKDTEMGDTVYRDYCEAVKKEDPLKELLMMPWNPVSFRHKSFKQVEPDIEYFLDGHIKETLPDIHARPPVVDANRPLKVYSDYEYVTKYLTDPSFEVMGDDEKSEDADIYWFTKHFKGYEEFSQNYPNKFVNQFPFENVITIKDLLSIVCRRTVKESIDPETLMTSPKWLPTTYNLKTELQEFVSLYQHRQDKKMDNHWIIKPWNLARSLDTSITSNLSEIIRLAQTGPKIVQKYVETPLLFYRPLSGGKVKFDVRYVILLKNVDELEVYVHKQFFLRFANIPFEMNEFDVYEKHFTVMNYDENLVLQHLKCEDFLEEWKDQYGEYPWEDIENDICDMLKEMFIAATKEKAPKGICPSPQSRALYAADIMLSLEDGKVQPKLLECNWTPDCKRACEYYPDFYNDIFKLMFLNVDNHCIFRRVV